MATSARNFTFVTYPESLTLENLINHLNGLLVPYVISPLHDEDKNEDGSLKKPHYHVVLEFKGRKNIDTVKSMVSTIGVNYVEIVNDKTQMERYLFHLDNPEKAQYPTDDCITKNVDINKCLECTDDDRIKTFSDIMEFIDDNNITMFTTLMRYARVEKKEWCLKIIKNSYFFKEYLKSLEYELRESEEK